MPATTCEEPTTRRAVAFSPDPSHFHIKQSLQTDLCRASLALRTAGFNNVAYSGPQVQLIGAPIWDRYVPGILSSLTPAAQVFSEQPWRGPVF